MNEGYIGETPIEDYVLAEGSYRLRLRLEGYYDFSGDFEVKMNEVMDGNVSLRKVEVAPVVPSPAPISPPVVNPAAPDGRQAVTRNADWYPRSPRF
ncbi:MAG: PEGA domain-containing protein [Deinococcales bacterium]